MYWLCYCVASCNRYLMLINHPTDGATRGLTLRVHLLGRIKIKIKISSLIRSNTVIAKIVAKRYPVTSTRSNGVDIGVSRQLTESVSNYQSID